MAIQSIHQCILIQISQINSVNGHSGLDRNHTKSDKYSHYGEHNNQLKYDKQIPISRKLKIQ